MQQSLIAGVSLREVLGSQSIFRIYQNRFLERFGPTLEGDLIEIGSDPARVYERFFPKATSFIHSNVTGLTQEWDVTSLPFDDSTQDGFVCISVIEHVAEARRGLAELHRTLRPGGTLLLSVPFMFPIHDDYDYWRPSRDGLLDLFSDYEITHLVHLGGKFSTVCNFLQRPVGKWRGARDRASKGIAVLLALLARFDQLDDSPLGFGVRAVKR